jgi:hypothetical protein
VVEYSFYFDKFIGLLDICNSLFKNKQRKIYNFKNNTPAIRERDKETEKLRNITTANLKTKTLRLEEKNMNGERKKPKEQ